MSHVDIPDTNLRVAIEKELDKATGDPISVNEMVRITELNAIELGVRCLTGLRRQGASLSCE